MKRHGGLLAGPYVAWMVLFTIVPMLLVVWFAFTGEDGRMTLSNFARLLDYAVAGVDPSVMGLGPVFATRKLLEKTGIPLKDIDLIELNEAFAAQAIACIRDLGLDPARVNVNGSGISLGHPIGATGAIISVKLIHEMIKRKMRYGISTLCIGGGQGMSALFEIL